MARAILLFYFYFLFYFSFLFFYLVGRKKKNQPTFLGESKKMRGSALLCICLIIFVERLLGQVEGLNLTSKKMQVKEGKLFGAVGVKYAQWDFEFDEDIYANRAAGCAAGLCRPEFQYGALQKDPCFPGCDWSLQGVACGTAFNRSNPQCQAYCDANRAIWCANSTQWQTLEIG